MANRIKEYFTCKLWMVKGEKQPFFLRTFLDVLRVAVLTLNHFQRNNCISKAAGLTFYTLFSIIPILALIFGIAQGFGLSQLLNEQIYDMAAGQPEIAGKLLDFSNSMLKNARGGVVAGVGTILLLWSAVKLLGNIEANLNAIWGVEQGRTFIRKITDYTAILLVCPLLLIAAGGGMVFAASQTGNIVKYYPFLQSLHECLIHCHGLLPWLMIWVVLVFAYMALPNTKVRFLPAAGAALLTAAIYILLQKGFIQAQFTTAKFNAVYGSFAAVPLFLLWLNLSWIVILTGAQISFAMQNVHEYELLPVDGTLSQFQRHLYSMEIIGMLSHAFQNGLGPLTDEAISKELELPIRTIRQLLRDLTDCRILMESQPAGSIDLHTYSVALPLEKLTPSFLIRNLDRIDEVDLMRSRDAEFLKVYQTLQNAAESSPENRPMLNLMREKRQK